MSSRENLTLELKIISANNVSHINLTDTMEVYAVVSIIGGYSQTQPAKTPIDTDGGCNPTWNHPVKFSINEGEAREGQLTVNVKLYSYWLEGSIDLEIGEVNVSVQELLGPNQLPPLTNGNGDKMKLMTLPVEVTGGTDAKLNLSYRFKPVLTDNKNHSQSDWSKPELADNKNPSLSDSRRFTEPIVNPAQFQTPLTTKLTLHLVIKRTNGIKDNSWFHGMDISACVAVRDGTIIKHRTNTPIVYRVHKNPIWNHSTRISLEEALAREGRLTLSMQLISHRTILGDIEIGEVKVPIDKLLTLHPPSTLNKDMNLVTCDVMDPSGRVGTLSFMFRFSNEQAKLSPATPQVITPPPAPPTTTPQTIIPPPAPPTTSPQQYIIYSYHGVTVYGTGPPGERPGTSNGLHVINMNQPPHDEKKVSSKLHGSYHK